MEYITRDGLVVVVGRVNRRLLDRIDIPTPAPPTKKVETWGDVLEDVPVLNDAQYLRRLQAWRVKVWRENIKVISQALTYTVPQSDIDALRAIGISADASDTIAYLQNHIRADDQDNITDLVYYHSTVTARGVLEAEERFNYTWRDKPLSAWGYSYTFGRRGQLGVDYRAAIRSGLTWMQFCDLTGPEQSELVAFWMLEDKLTWLLTSNK